MVNNRESSTNGVILCDFSKIGNRWVTKARNLFTKNTYHSKDVIPVLQNIFKGDFSGVKLAQVQ